MTKHDPLAGGRAIPWDALDVQSLAPERRAVLGEYWRARRVQEHLSVGAFAIVSAELADEGCDPLVLSLATRAANDEVRHAEICRRLAAAFLGDASVPARLRGTPGFLQHEDPSTRALLRVVEMCCFGETLAGVVLAEMHARATNPAVRAAVASMLEDEIDHGRIGWAYLAERVRAGSAQAVSEALPNMLERNVGGILAAQEGAPLAEDPELEAYGFIDRARNAAIVREAVRDVILAGFAAAGIDVTAANAFARASCWA